MTQPKKPFEAGDRIKFVGSYGEGPDKFASEPTKAQVAFIEDQYDAIGIVINKGKGEQREVIHPRQVTHRIVKKKKPTSTWFLVFDDKGRYKGFFFSARLAAKTATAFGWRVAKVREVKK